MRLNSRHTNPALGVSSLWVFALAMAMGSMLSTSATADHHEAAEMAGDAAAEMVGEAEGAAAEAGDAAGAMADEMSESAADGATTAADAVGDAVAPVAAVEAEALDDAVAPLAAVEADDEDAPDPSDVITIRARRRAEALDTVPISVSAFSGTSLEALQIDDTLDIQFKTPNLSFGKTNFTGANIQIRGIGSAVVAASGEAAVGTHINQVPQGATRLYEIEFYDMEGIEVLRGPQGTLFGRNSTGGTINLTTAKPTSEYEANAEFLAGNFDTYKVKAMLNIPIHEKVRTRFAGFLLERDGYINNIRTGNRIDDRSIYSVRGSLGLDITDTTKVEAMVQWFDEDDSRSRIGKQLCTQDTSPFPSSIGCTDGPLAFETPASHSTLGGILETIALFPDEIDEATEGLILGGGNTPGNDIDFLPLYPVGANVTATADNPPDLRTHNSRFDPEYKTDDLVATLDISQEIGDFTVNWLSGYHRSRVDSRQDYNMVSGDVAYDPASVASFALIPSLAAVMMDGRTGFDLGEFGFTDSSFARDRSKLDFTGLSTEIRLSSDLEDSFFNFTAGSIFSYSSSDTDYFVFFSGAEVLSRVSAFFDPNYDPDLRFFDTESKPAITRSLGMFGEVYFDVLDNLRLTAGARYTYDRKRVRSRQNLLNAGGQKVGFDTRTAAWHAATGRVIADWTPDVPFTDHTLLYASISRGYKPGGFNPAIDETLFTVSGTFDPETIWAYEVGTKNRFWDNKVQTSVSGFFYDYRDYQISKIVARTSVNENIDAFVWGLEAEVLAKPIDGVQLDLGLAYLGTDIRSGESIDTADPTAGDPTLDAVKNVANGSNIVIPVGADPFDPAVVAASTDGVAKSLKGRELPNTPDVQINVGGQYTHTLPREYGSVTGRLDYYYQTEMFGRMFNETRDKIDSWSQADATLSYAYELKNGGTLYVDFWIKNFTDNDDITTHYFTDASSGNFTNVFVLEPRTYGLTLGGSY